MHIDGLVAQQSKIDMEGLERRKAKIEDSRGATESELETISNEVKMSELRLKDLEGRLRSAENLLRSRNSSDFKKLQLLKSRYFHDPYSFPDSPISA